MGEQKHKATNLTPTMTQTYLHKNGKKNTTHKITTELTRNTTLTLPKNVDIKADTIRGGLCGGSGRHRPLPVPATETETS